MKLKVIKETRSYRVLNLNDVLEGLNISVDDFALECGASLETVKRWISNRQGMSWKYFNWLTKYLANKGVEVEYVQNVKPSQNKSSGVQAYEEDVFKSNLEREIIFKISEDKSLLSLVDLLEREMLEPANRELYDELIEFKREIENNNLPFTPSLFKMRVGAQDFEISDSDVFDLIEAYNQLVYKKKLKNKLSQLSKLDYSELDFNTVIDEINSVVSRIKPRDEFSIRTLVSQVIENFGTEERLFCHLKSLDSITGGFQKGQYVIFASRPSVGKTTVLLNLAYDYAKQGKEVVFFSLEQSGAEITKRLMNIALKRRIDTIEEAMVSASELADLKIYVYDNAYSVSTMAYILRRYHPNCEVVFVDYAQLIPITGKNGNIVHEYTAISNSLKRIAKELGVVMIVASQLNRNVENRKENKPKLSDLRESGAFEQDADVVILMSKEITAHGVILNMNIAKNRNGATGEVNVKFNMPAFYVYD